MIIKVFKTSTEKKFLITKKNKKRERLKIDH